MTWQKGTTKGIARSIKTYYRDAARTARMDRLNAAFVRPGDMAFDIGAHVGDRIASYRRLGARVVAVEPQPAVFRALRLLYGRDLQIDLHAAAVGAAPGQVKFYVNTDNPTTSTAEKSLVEAAVHADAWRDQVWDQEITTSVMTLDQLIAASGLPDFLKIDVEGHEAKVLQGLSQPIHRLSFEFTTLQRKVALAALRILQELGPYRYNYSLGETHALVLADWTDASTMACILGDLPEAANSGDVYALSHEC